MGSRPVILKAVVVLLVIWLGVWGVRAWASTRRVTAKMIEKEILEAKLEDWSTLSGDPDPSQAKRRDGQIREIAGLVNRLDFRERQKSREDRSNEIFFSKLSPRERELFFDLTIKETMNTFMEAIDAMPPDQRKRFVEDGLREIESGRTAEEMTRARELGQDLLTKASEQGLRAYFEKASAETKLDLAPLMEAMNETMQGMRGNQFGPQK